jgi:hypothetical protein
MKYYNRMLEVSSIIAINQDFRNKKYNFSEDEKKNEILNKYLVTDEVLENLKDIVNFFKNNQLIINKL